jgi:hemerythrin superfamily protein
MRGSRRFSFRAWARALPWVALVEDLRRSEVRHRPTDKEHHTMATATRKTAAKPASPATKTARAPARRAQASTAETVGPDATVLLRADHKRVSALFEAYESTRSAKKKQGLVAQICNELSVHAQVEEEIFYPAVKAALKDKELVPEAIVEHATLKELIAQVEGKEPDGEMFDAKIKVMSEYVKHHVKEEQNEMFPKARNARLDLNELGARIAARKEELLAMPRKVAAEPGLFERIADAVA